MPHVLIEEAADGRIVATCEASGDEIQLDPAPGTVGAEAHRNALKVLDSTCGCGASDHQEAR